MASTYKTPGVYVEEISTLPASIAQVETAIPAFIGYTEKALKNGKEVLNKPTRIKSLLDFEEYFGKAPDTAITVTLDTDNSIKTVSGNSTFILYDSMRMFFSNGGGPCYIVSVGNYDAASVGYDDLKAGLDTLVKEDEPTLIVIPDAVSLDIDDLGTLQNDVLSQCNTLQDRFGVFDVKNGDADLNSADANGDNPIAAFRNSIGARYLKYGASYYPFIRTTLSFDYNYSDISWEKNGGPSSLASVTADKTYVNQLDKVVYDINNLIDPLLEEPESVDPSFWNGVAAYADKTMAEAWEQIELDGDKSELTSRLNFIAAMLEEFISWNGTLTDADSAGTIEEKTLKDLHDKAIAAAESGEDYTEIEGYVRTLVALDDQYEDSEGGPDDLGAFDTGDFIDYDITALPDLTGAYKSGDSFGTESATVATARSTYQELFESVLAFIEDFQAEAHNRMESLTTTLKDTNSIYAAAVSAINQEGIVLPPSGAVVGIYAATDRERGVWKAPANVSINAMSGPVVKIDAADQADMNVDTTAGKSVNAIRAFTGRGNLVWGARTLAGNDNEWRYISVRRFYNMVEESVKKATESLVFEPNDANTWVRVRAMVENYLRGLWRAGALAGAKPEDAFFVKVGLGTTMTSTDILEGRMIIEIGMAAVRPAEFIILKFSHKMQES